MLKAIKSEGNGVVERFIYSSTDKAEGDTHYGQTKLISELLI